MGQVIFIGDEVTAAGFRLAGVDCASPAQADLPALFETACDDCELVMITAEYAKWLGAGVVENMALRARPLLAVLPDIRGHVPAPDLEHAVRRELGIEG